MRNEYDSLARALAMTETPEERAAVGAAVAAYYRYTPRSSPRDGCPPRGDADTEGPAVSSRPALTRADPS